MRTCVCFFPVLTANVCVLCNLPLTYVGKAEVLRTQDECVAAVKSRLYALRPARLRSYWKGIWESRTT